MSVSTRLSNIELLRIIAMFGVLLVHADFATFGEPTKLELLSDTTFCVSRIFIEAFAVVAVNVFVLISGWFGINFKWKSLANLLFQCFFFLFGIYIVLILLGEQQFSLGGACKCLMLSSNVWFVKTYLGLFIMSPVLNAFVEHSSQTIFKNVLICFFIFQSLYGWLFDATYYIDSGYSAWSFMGLYLIARYIKKYKPFWSSFAKNKDLLLYISFSIFTGIALLIFTYFDNFSLRKFWSYTSPFVILAAVYLLLFFSKLNIQSKAINWIATSCFAVYLMHFYIFHDYMEPCIKHLVEVNSGIMIPVSIFALLCAFYIIAILIDKIRLFIWKKISVRIYK